MRLPQYSDTFTVYMGIYMQGPHAVYTSICQDPAEQVMQIW